MIPHSADTDTVSPLERWLPIYRKRGLLSQNERIFVEAMVEHYYQQRVTLPPSFRDPYNASRNKVRTLTSIERLYPSIGNKQFPITAAPVQSINESFAEYISTNYVGEILKEQGFTCTITIGEKQ